MDSAYITVQEIQVLQEELDLVSNSTFEESWVRTIIILKKTLETIAGYQWLQEASKDAPVTLFWVSFSQPNCRKGRIVSHLCESGCVFFQRPGSRTLCTTASKIKTGGIERWRNFLPDFQTSLQVYTEPELLKCKLKLRLFQCSCFWQLGLRACGNGAKNKS